MARKQVDKSYFEKWNPDIDYRKHPEMYRIGRGQQGVLLCEPYKSDICAHWRFKTVREAQVSSQNILMMFYTYVNEGDFVGADMAKKFLHMGFTRARRYANHRDGRKYNDDGSIIPQEPDALTCEKAQSARIFYACWKEAREFAPYLAMKQEHRQKYEKKP
jgi:hypothetical protein|tara:strand:- start:7826 stop:8308 length:483 start_codon:yes stop_codon:yes gene_type:complete